jgi:hypothetical protein
MEGVTEGSIPSHKGDAMLTHVRLMTTLAPLALALGSASASMADALTADPRNPVSNASETPPIKEHALLPLIKLTRERLKALDTIRDYTCTVWKRERIGGVLKASQKIDVKIREEQVRKGRVIVPFAVNLVFQTPEEVAGRTITYVHGEHDGKMFVRKGGPRFGYIKTLIDPTSDAAQRESRYPITELGFKCMLKRLLDIADRDTQHDECQVQYFTDASINGRSCTAIRINHPVPRPYFEYHIAEIFIDNQLQLPVRYAAYDWPYVPAAKPRLMEECTITDLKLNVGLKDSDFTQE